MAYEAFPREFAPLDVEHENASQPFPLGRPFWQQLLDTIGFTVEDLMWSAALWLAVLGLAPFIVFYVLMVN